MVTLQPVQPELLEHPFFHGLERKDLELLSRFASHEHFAAGEYIFREGDTAEKFFIVQRGLVAVEYNVPGGTSITLYTHSDGDVMGWSWIFPPYDWVCSGRAVEPTRVITFDAGGLRKELDANPALGYEFMKRFAHKVTKTMHATRLQLLDMFSKG